MLLTKYDHITPSLIRVHWLPVKFRVNFKVATLVFKCIYGNDPDYLKNLILFRTLYILYLHIVLIHFRFIVLNVACLFIIYFSCKTHLIITLYINLRYINIKILLFMLSLA